MGEGCQGGVTQGQRRSYGPGEQEKSMRSSCSIAAPSGIGHLITYKVTGREE